MIFYFMLDCVRYKPREILHLKEVKTSSVYFDRRELLLYKLLLTFTVLLLYEPNPFCRPGFRSDRLQENDEGLPAVASWCCWVAGGCCSW